MLTKLTGRCSAANPGWQSNKEMMQKCSIQGHPLDEERFFPIDLPFESQNDACLFSIKLSFHFPTCKVRKQSLVLLHSRKKWRQNKIDRLNLLRSIDLPSEISLIGKESIVVTSDQQRMCVLFSIHPMPASVWSAFQLFDFNWLANLKGPNKQNQSNTES